MIIGYIGLIILFSLLMVRATDMMMQGVRSLVLSSNLQMYGIASFILAFSTSIPELMVGISAGLQGQPELALGNVLGSNIANMSLVLGGAALISGVLQAQDTFLRREVFYVFLAGSLPLVLLLDESLTRLDGMILILVYVVYNMTILGRKREILAEGEVHHVAWWRRALVRVTRVHVDRSVVAVLMGTGLLVISADMLVRIATQLAIRMEIPTLVVGMFVVAIGTSLPELVFEIVAVKRQEVAMAFGNVLGSVVTNSTLVMGITVMLGEIRLTQGLSGYVLATLAFVVVFGLFWVFVWTKRQLERWEGLALIGAYAAFVFLELASR